MWRLLRFLFVGYWAERPSLRDLGRRVRELETRCDYTELDLKKLRGRVVGGIRHADEDDEDDFPESEFQRLIAERRSTA